MSGTERQNRAERFVFLCTALLFAAFFLGEADLRRQEVFPVQLAGNAAVFVAMAVLTPFAARLTAGRQRLRAFLSRSEIRNLMLLAVIAVLPRIAWGLAVPVRIDSDYGLYVRMGQCYAETGRPEIDNYMLTVAPNTVTYSVLTGLLMRLFGTSAMTLVAFTEILHAANVLLVYGVGRQMTSRARAFAAAAVFALLPENIFYSNTPGIEAPAMFTALAGLLAVLAGRRQKSAGRTLLCGTGGATLVLSACIRPNAYVILFTAAVLLLQEKEPVKGKVLRLAALLTGAVLVFCGYQALKGQLFVEQQPVSGLGWSMYEGLDLESGGKWTEEKSKRCIEVIGKYGPEEADAIFRQEAMERFRGYSFSQKLRMVLRKGGSLWYESRYSIFAIDTAGTWKGWRQIADFGWYGCLAAFIAGLLYRWRKPMERTAAAGAGLTLAVILLTTAWHCVGTSIGRYHYMLIPFVPLMAAKLLPGHEKRPVPERSADQ